MSPSSPSDPATRAGLRTTQVVDVLRQLDAELGPIDDAVRAIVGLRAEPDGTVALVDVALQADQVLVPPADADGLVVVTSEQVAHGEDVVPLQQLVSILPDGREIGVYRIADVDDLRSWRTDADPDDEAPALRPRDVASNAARRAFGLPSLVEGPMPVEELCARAWLVAVSAEAITRFDAPEGPREVEVEELIEVAARPVLGGLVPDADAPLPSWTQVHEAAVRGELELGPFTVDPAHAAWLDEDGFAQTLDRTLPPIEELLGSLRIAGGDDAMAWAIDELLRRDWHRVD
ncbi:MAG: hypothetical protein JJT89_04070 [Nitriliruptoraceae bacterium]|nr:hypothetical protein [Nitriliruptoraceae bacterium]